VLVQPLEEQEVKKGGIIIPDTAKEKPQEGKVVALGTGKIDDNGKKVDFTVKKGDKVLISKYGGTEIKIDDENYLIMREDDILGMKVVALGTGKIDDNGKKVDFTVKKGDKVLISKYGGTEIKIDDENYLIMREDDILGIIG